jgi:hypothetical protein
MMLLVGQLAEIDESLPGRRIFREVLRYSPTGSEGSSVD